MLYSLWLAQVHILSLWEFYLCSIHQSYNSNKIYQSYAQSSSPEKILMLPPLRSKPCGGSCWKYWGECDIVPGLKVYTPVLFLYLATTRNIALHTFKPL